MISNIAIRVLKREICTRLQSINMEKTIRNGLKIDLLYAKRPGSKMNPESIQEGIDFSSMTIKRLRSEVLLLINDIKAN